MVVRSKGVTIVYFTILVVYNDYIEPTGHLSLDKKLAGILMDKLSNN